MFNLDTKNELSKNLDMNCKITNLSNEEIIKSNKYTLLKQTKNLI